MTSWAALDAELARWRDDGRVATVWWRDDDAKAATPALENLLAVAARHDVGVAIAAIPASLDPSLAARLASAGRDVVVLQHGYAHQNHAPAGEKKIELGPHRPAMPVIGELGTGMLALSQAFGDRFLPVLVPPWNRIAPTMVPVLPEIGFRALSASGVRKRAEPVRGFRQVNTHVDPVDWRGTRGFAGEARALAALTGHLAARRAAGTGSPAVALEATGVLTHHRGHGPDVWGFLDELWNRLHAHAGARIVSPREIFGP
ncbi:MAG: polysaccharide deacetylase family protein [Rhodospirillales bacterium]|nr:MAG: polysaccharide deacetylase family protein [Rhodospirillales bacterium]